MLIAKVTCLGAIFCDIPSTVQSQWNYAFAAIQTKTFNCVINRFHSICILMFSIKVLWPVDSICRLWLLLLVLPLKVERDQCDLLIWWFLLIDNWTKLNDVSWTDTGQCTKTCRDTSFERSHKPITQRNSNLFPLIYWYLDIICVIEQEFPI